MIFKPFVFKDRIIIIADGIKIPKEGKKMPAVKKLHQTSSNNSKPSYIMGHSLQALGILVKGRGSQVLSIPIAPRIHEGVIFSNLHKKSLLDKLISLIDFVLSSLKRNILLVADAYYGSKNVIEPLLAKDNNIQT